MEHAIVNKIRAILMNKLDLVAYPPTRVAVQPPAKIPNAGAVDATMFYTINTVYSFYYSSQII